jgi:hypothetical protein
MMITRTSLDRRTLLRGAGVAIGLPLLDAMVPALTALERSAARPTRRFGVFYVPNGFSVGAGHWTPTRTGADFELPFVMEPLAPFRKALLVVCGLSNKEANPLPGEGAGDHARGPGSFLTGVHIKKTQGADIQAGVSLDQIVARSFSTETQIESLQLGLESIETLGTCDPGYACAYRSTVSWRTPTAPLPIENQPRAVFERLFGDGGTTRRSVQLALLQQRRSLLDAVRQDIERLKGSLGRSDHAKVSEYLDSVRDVERRVQMAERQGAREVPAGDEPAGGIPSSFEEHFRLMADLLVLAYQTDLTRVFTFMMAEEQSNRTYLASGVSEGHHPLSHHMYVPATLEKLAKINRYHVDTFTYFLQRLRDTPDGDGSLLDHSITMYGGGISDPDVHSHEDMTTILVGSGGGHLQGGRHLRFDRSTPLANLHVTLLDKLGTPVERLGDSTGPLEGLSGI